MVYNSEQNKQKFQSSLTFHSKGKRSTPINQSHSICGRQNLKVSPTDPYSCVISSGLELGWNLWMWWKPLLQLCYLIWQKRHSVHLVNVPNHLNLKQGRLSGWAWLSNINPCLPWRSETGKPDSKHSRIQCMEDSLMLIMKGTAWQGPESILWEQRAAPGWQQENWDPLPQLQETDFCREPEWAPNQIFPRASPWKIIPANALISALWDTKQSIQLCHVELGNYRMFANKWELF